MEVNNAVKSIAFMLTTYPLAQGPEVVAKMDDARGLDAG